MDVNCGVITVVDGGKGRCVCNGGEGGKSGEWKGVEWQRVEMWVEMWVGKVGKRR